MSNRQPNTRPRQRAQQITIDADTFARRRGSVPTVRKDAEFRCDTCGARCTETTAGTECGHKYGCPERPDGLPDGSGSGGFYGGDDA